MCIANAFFYKRQNPHFTLCGSFFITNLFKGNARRRRAGRSIGKYRASLHAYGGALYSVTCSQRKDHYTRLCLLARSLANGCFAAAVFVALSLVDSPPKPGLSRRTRCPAPHKRNVSACPMQLYRNRLLSACKNTPGNVLLQTGTCSEGRCFLALPLPLIFVLYVCRQHIQEVRVAGSAG